MREYIILRDLQALPAMESVGGRYRGGPGPNAFAGPPEPQVDVETLDRKELLDLARDPRVRGAAPVMPTKLIQPVGEPSQAGAGDAWGIASVGADGSAFTGDGVVVAVLDTGIDRDHPAFAGVTLVEEDFTGSGNGDRQGHGSHCAGTIFGQDVSGGRIGVAPGISKALIAKVLPDEGGGTSDMVVRAINWAVEEGADVISMSLGWDFSGWVARLIDGGLDAEPATSQALEDYRLTLGMFDAAMELVRKRGNFGSGTVIVAASGNESRRNQYEIATSLPAAADGIISVGALQQDGALLAVASFSNSLPKVSAPGVKIKSVQAGGGTVEMNGTSMACPHVAGLAALWWESVRGGGAVQPSSLIVQAKLIASARTDVFAAGVDMADRGVGLATAP